MARYENVAICDKCWEVRRGEQVPVRLKDVSQETCFGCGASTTSGIYVRHNVHNPWLSTAKRAVGRAHQVSRTHSSAFLRERPT